VGWSVRPTQRIATYQDYLGYAAFQNEPTFSKLIWMEITFRDELSVRDARWSEAVAVGNLNFVEKMKSEKSKGGDSVAIQNLSLRRLRAGSAQRLNGLNGRLLTNEGLGARKHASMGENCRTCGDLA
jgi:hypothetical protein